MQYYGIAALLTLFMGTTACRDPQQTHQLNHYKALHDPCRLPQKLGAEYIPISFKHGPKDEAGMWSGSTLPIFMPDAKAMVRCRPCSCSKNRIIPWDAWHAINMQAFDQLRTAQAPYPVAIVPGFHSSTLITNKRLKVALKLVKLGWAAALLVSGGHRRSGLNEAKYMYETALALGKEMQLDMRGRIFVEPCATKSITNLRNSMRMLAIMGLPRGLLVTDSHLSGQSYIFNNRLPTLIARDLKCHIGRVSHLFGAGPFPRNGKNPSGCQPPLGLRSNPIGIFLPGTFVSVFWVSPADDQGSLKATLQCHGGTQAITKAEPDNLDPFNSACLPTIGEAQLTCSEKGPAQVN